MAIDPDHETEEVVKSLSELCSELDIKCLIQVGAGDGYEASKIRDATGCRAIAIEANVAYVAYNTNIEYHHNAIWSDAGMRNFYVNDMPGLSGHFPRNDGQERVMYGPTQTLDMFCEVGGGIQPDALIIDTEGSTMEVLEGCSGLLSGVRLVYAEVQTEEIMQGIRLASVVDDHLCFVYGFEKHSDLPSYLVNKQGNMTWVRK